METRETRTDAAGEDFRRCRTCSQWVPLGMRCLCEMVQDQHLQNVRQVRQMCGAPPVVSYACPEPPYAESDAQDAPVPDPTADYLVRAAALVAGIVVAASAAGAVVWLIWAVRLP